MAPTLQAYAPPTYSFLFSLLFLYEERNGCNIILYLLLLRFSMRTLSVIIELYLVAFNTILPLNRKWITTWYLTHNIKHWYYNLLIEKPRKKSFQRWRFFLKKDIFKMSKKPKCLLEWRRIFQEKWFSLEMLWKCEKRENICDDKKFFIIKEKV